MCNINEKRRCFLEAVAISAIFEIRKARSDKRTLAKWDIVWYNQIHSGRAVYERLGVKAGIWRGCV